MFIDTFLSKRTLIISTNKKGMSYMKVTIDRSNCISCAICEELCPEVFQMDVGGFAEIVAQPDSSNEASVRQAVEDCPSSVIFIED